MINSSRVEIMHQFGAFGAFGAPTTIIGGKKEKNICQKTLFLMLKSQLGASIAIGLLGLACVGMAVLSYSSRSGSTSLLQDQVRKHQVLAAASSSAEEASSASSVTLRRTSGGCAAWNSAPSSLALAPSRKGPRPRARIRALVSLRLLRLFLV